MRSLAGGAVVKARRGLLDNDEEDDDIAAVERSAREVVTADDFIDRKSVV